MIVYGRNPVREAIRGKRRVQRVYATERASHEVLLAEVDSRIVPVEEVEERAGSPDHQGICAEVEAYTYADADSLLEAEDALVLALDEIQDPHNLGAICRVAESAGCAGVVLPERRSAEITPAPSSIWTSRACATWPSGSAAPRSTRPGCTGPLPTPASRITGPTIAAVSWSCWAPRGEGCARAWPRPATS